MKSSNKLLTYYCIDCGMSFGGGMRCPRCHSYRLSHTVDNTEPEVGELGVVEEYLQEVFAQAKTMEPADVQCFCGRPDKHKMVYPKMDGERLTSLPFCPFRVRTFSRSMVHVPDSQILDKLGV